MKLTIIGHGNVGGALAKSFAKAGHHITIGARNVDSEKLSSLKEAIPNLKIAQVEDSHTHADAIIIATPAQIATQLATQLGDLTGKIMIDTTNAVFKKPEPYLTAFDAFQKICNADVAKCFNSTGFENMAQTQIKLQRPIPHEVALDMLVAGSSEKAKAVAKKLAEDIGYICYDFGGDDKVLLLEQFALAWINLAIMQGVGRDIAFKILKRSQN